MNRDIDQIIESVRKSFAVVQLSQLQVEHPGVDDDGIWFFTLPEAPRSRHRRKEIQLESPVGMCPFTVEHDDMKSSSEAETARSIEEAVTKVCTYLSSLEAT